MLANFKSSRGSRAKNKAIKKANLKSKRFTRDIDQIVLEDKLPEKAEKLLHQDLDENKQGLG